MVDLQVVRMAEEFPNLFKRKGRVNNYEIKIEMKKDAKVSQQKGDEYQFNCKGEVDKEIDAVIKRGHIEKVDKYVMMCSFSQL